MDLLWLSLLKIKKTLFISGLTVRNDKYDRKGTEVNVILKKRYNDKNLRFIEKEDKIPHMLTLSRRFLYNRLRLERFKQDQTSPN